jgi:hypothetical protein
MRLPVRKDQDFAQLVRALNSNVTATKEASYGGEE